MRMGLQESNDHQQATMVTTRKLRKRRQPQGHIYIYIYMSSIGEETHSWLRRHRSKVDFYDTIWVDDLAIMIAYFCLMVYVLHIVAALQFDF